MAYKFKAIEKDKETLVHNGDKTKKVQDGTHPSRLHRSMLKAHRLLWINMSVIGMRGTSLTRFIMTKLIKSRRIYRIF